MKVKDPLLSTAGAETDSKNTVSVSAPAPKSIVEGFAERIAAKRAGRLATTPASYRKLFERSWAGKASPRTAIKCFCLECVGFERAAISQCSVGACPLWPLRPYQQKGGVP